MRLGECLVTKFGITCVTHRSSDFVALYVCARLAEEAVRAMCAHIVDVARDLNGTDFLVT
jgi:hypothetical protein